jgi:hypothetical protein
MPKASFKWKTSTINKGLIERNLCDNIEHSIKLIDIDGEEQTLFIDVSTPGKYVYPVIQIILYQFEHTNKPSVVSQQYTPKLTEDAMEELKKIQNSISVAISKAQKNESYVMDLRRWKFNRKIFISTTDVIVNPSLFYGSNPSPVIHSSVPTIVENVSTKSSTIDEEEDDEDQEEDEYTESSKRLMEAINDRIGFHSIEDKEDAETRRSMFIDLMESLLRGDITVSEMNDEIKSRSSLYDIRLFH